MIILGVDPGKSGGIACWIPSKGMAATKMGDTEKDVLSYLDCFPTANGGFAYIEKVHAMPSQGVTSMFTFGQNYGFLRGCLTALEIPFEAVTPHRWQKEFSLLRRDKNESNTDKKNRHKAKAQQLFPHLKVTHATADALLICEYGRRLRCQQTPT